MGEDKAEVDRVFHALGDPTRRRILKMLSERPHSVKGLAGPLGITLTAVAQQLQLLEKAGLVRTEKIGRVRTCRMTRRAGGGRPWIEACRPIWSRRLDRLGDLLNEEEGPPEQKRIAPGRSRPDTARVRLASPTPGAAARSGRLVAAARRPALRRRGSPFRNGRRSGLLASRSGGACRAGPRRGSCLFRVLLLPRPGEPVIARRLALSVALFVLWHPPQALIFGPHWGAVVLNPGFLAAVAAIGARARAGLSFAPARSGPASCSTGPQSWPGKPSPARRRPGSREADLQQGRQPLAWETSPDLCWREGSDARRNPGGDWHRSRSKPPAIRAHSEAAEVPFAGRCADAVA